jgi:hypothetical protein
VGGHDESAGEAPGAAVDPVRVQRARWARWAATGKRVGYGLILVAVVAFTVGAVSGFGTVVTTTVTAALVGSTVTLAPGIVVAYAVKAAEREDREHGR